MARPVPGQKERRHTVTGNSLQRLVPTKTENAREKADRKCGIRLNFPPQTLAF